MFSERTASRAAGERLEDVIRRRWAVPPPHNPSSLMLPLTSCDYQMRLFPTSEACFAQHSLLHKLVSSGAKQREREALARVPP